MEFDTISPSQRPDYFIDHEFKCSSNADAVTKWVTQLASCQISVANRYANDQSKETILEYRMRMLAQSDRTFGLSFHKSGAYNSTAMTTVVCDQCGAKLMIDHPGTIMLHVMAAPICVTPFVTHYIEIIEITQV